MFDFKELNRQFLIKNENRAEPYGVYIERIIPTSTQIYYKCIGVCHLLPTENNGNHNIYIGVVNSNGDRIPHLFAGFTWQGKRPDEVVRPVPLDKPEYEPAGNIDVYWGQRMSVWIGKTSDIVHNLHTMHPDEGPGNTLGHHSFYVVFQELVGNTTPDPTPDPDPTPIPRPPLFNKVVLDNELIKVTLKIEFK